jgi:hypothetical protein
LPFALLEFNATLLPLQMVTCPLGVIVGVAGIGFTVTVVAADGALEQLFEVTVTL